LPSTSQYFEQSVYNHILRSDTFAKPTPSVGLTLNVPNSNGFFTEVTGGGYTRFPNAYGDLVWDAMSVAGSGTNLVEFTFGVATSDWGGVSGVVILDESSNLLFHGELQNPREVKQGDEFILSPGHVTVVIS
jgi:hypothetical protein